MSTYVVQGTSRLAKRDDLDGAVRSVGRAEASGQRQVWDAEGALARLVPEGRRQSIVEVCDVVAESQVDEDVGPRVVQVQDEAAAGGGPVGAVT